MMKLETLGYKDHSDSDTIKRYVKKDKHYTNEIIINFKRNDVLIREYVGNSKAIRLYSKCCVPFDVFKAIFIIISAYVSKMDNKYSREDIVAMFQDGISTFFKERKQDDFIDYFLTLQNSIIKGDD